MAANTWDQVGVQVLQAARVLDQEVTNGNYTIEDKLVFRDIPIEMLFKWIDTGGTRKSDLYQCYDPSLTD
ncbi:MAG: hypothetical protein HYU97_03900 [Deltaproteobacteria bacterium]|nr:hypothetical protein [Deltaproteobacteria bacterium]